MIGKNEYDAELIALIDETSEEAVAAWKAIGEEMLKSSRQI